VSERMEAKEAAPFCAQAATLLTQAMAKTSDADESGALAAGLSAVSERMEAKEAASFCAQAATLLTQAMAKTSDARALFHLAQGLSAVAARLEAKEAAPFCAQAAPLLIRAMATHATDQNEWLLGPLAQGLSAVAARLEAKEAAPLYAQAITLLNQAMANPQVMDNLRARNGENRAVGKELAQGLSALAARLGAKEAATLLTKAMAKTREALALGHLTRGLSAVSARLEAKEAANLLIQAMGKTTDKDALRELAKGLLSALSGPNPKERKRWLRGVVTSFGLAASDQPLLTLPVLPPDLKLQPSPFSTQDLVDLLKQPLCVGKARRVVLDQLAFRYQRTFTDHWDFVRFAEENQFGLDLTSPPRRPDSVSR